ncbi:DUF4153 domain-containing protein [Parabacteroides bouchesdurhonensis]|uniref:DUF4153 domain-containing protein n=1 Tax=Parabacteroides bouchesdurhonensis TaxID=1936995 RepID=UPI000E504EA7|nr:DUF4153 domain-containing protein [Parabacteroides bouchesdurhonensis]RHJ91058.1 DUF4153 domain-containing protein [Bacteroides sp. AM07-16]
MNKKIEALWTRLLLAVQKNPAEVLLAVFFCVLGCYYFESRNEDWESVLSYSPVLFLTTYILNYLTLGKKGRVFYYISVLFFIPVYIWIENTFDITFWITLIIMQLIYMVSRWKLDNDAFMQVGIRYIAAWLAACLLTVIAWLLAISIYFSIHYIFEIWGNYEERFIAYATSFAFAGVMSLLFLMFNQNRDNGKVKNKVFDVLVNFVLSPALLIYAVILYLYFIKVTVIWSLPKGAVAYIVISFTSATFLLKGFQAFVSKRYYDWLYRWSSWGVLPALVMYWVGVYYRINQYGFTEARVYLVIIGLILTGTAFLFFSKRAGRYLYVSLLAIALLSAVTYIPGITAKDIERISQMKRDNYPPKTNYAGLKEDGYIESDIPVDIEGFRMMHKVFNYPTDKGFYFSGGKDSTILYNADESILFAEQTDSLFYRQLRKVGLTPYDSIPESVYPDLLRIDMDSAALILDYIYFQRDSVYQGVYMLPKCYLK